MMRVETGKWCVYGHLVNGKCIYVGMGRPWRAFNTHKRSSEWHELAGAGYDVAIISWHETKEECQAQEIELIHELTPTCNKMFNGWVPDAFKENWKRGRRRPLPPKDPREKRKVGGNGKVRLVCVETGQLFESMTIAAPLLGVSIAAVSRAVIGKRAVAGRFLIREEQHV